MPTATLPIAGTAPVFNAPQDVFTNPVTQLAALNPFAALAAADPNAALTALSPSLNIFNPAVNPNAAFLAFNPASAPTLALGSVQGPATLPFGKFGKPFGKGFGKPFDKGFGKPFGKGFGKPFGKGFGKPSGGFGKGCGSGGCGI
jgi:hypothetical protein